jgi:hypothetical protein
MCLLALLLLCCMGGYWYREKKRQQQQQQPPPQEGRPDCTPQDKRKDLDDVDIEVPVLQLPEPVIPVVEEEHITRTLSPSPLPEPVVDEEHITRAFSPSPLPVETPPVRVPTPPPPSEFQTQMNTYIKEYPNAHRFKVEYHEKVLDKFPDEPIKHNIPKKYLSSKASETQQNNLTVQKELKKILKERTDEIAML